MNRNQIKYLLFFFLLTGACKKDFLDIEDNTFFYRQQYVKNLATMSEFVNGISMNYTILAETGYMSAYPEITADNLKPTDLISGRLIPQYLWKQVADEISESSFNSAWQNGYKIIRSCNFVIEEIGQYQSENPEFADDLLAQAHFFRALVHFKLVNIFGQQYNYTADAAHPGIPYITDSDISKPYRRETVAVVYEKIAADYNRAIELFSAQNTDVKRPNRLAAKALLARFYLQKQDFPKALAYAKEVVNERPLMRIAQGYPEKLFHFIKDPSETEVLFQCSPNPRSAFNGSTFLGFHLGVLDQFHATNDIAQLLTETADDVRKVWISGSNGAYKIKKFPSLVPDVQGTFWVDAAYYQCVVRSSEMYLIIAEAAARTGDETTAKDYVTQLRQRAAPSSAVVNETGQGLLELIQKERRTELCFEGFRLYDLLRWKKGVNRIDAPISSAKDLPYPSDKAIAPIPLPDVNLMGIPQNKSY
ncbi:RagB/SusD family nutrient uptake outer membrane protein [Pedobacter sp. GR22-6]|uniref:RagB/SusD family nutrient uptake outer membrane protein n=1 Tax=Pedobacter sp. GR22-6 TaxID=3127957 RepID=UPI00307EB567